MDEYQNLELLEEFIKPYCTRVNESHFNAMCDSIYMAALREKLNIKDLLNDLSAGIIHKTFYTKENGNIYLY